MSTRLLSPSGKALGLLLAALPLMSCGNFEMSKWEPAAEMEQGVMHDGLALSASRSLANSPPSQFDPFQVSSGSETENFFADSDLLADASGEAEDPGARDVESQDPPPDRKMIYSASFSVLVASVQDSMARFLARLEKLGGYLSLRRNNSLTCRVPAKNFQALISEVPSLGKVLEESMQARDVTKEHMDLSIRLENAEKSRKRLLDLLDRASKVEDLLKIENELRRLTGEIEQMKGQLKYLTNQIAFSTVSVEFQAIAPEVKPRRKRTRSRFPWINVVGIEQVLRRF